MSTTEAPEFDFTPSQDWFGGNVAVWQPLLVQLQESLAGRAPRALEIGSWEGRSATFLLRTLCTAPGSELVCIDHVDLLKTDAGKRRFERLQSNLAKAAMPDVSYRVLDTFSVPALYQILSEEVTASDGGYDFIYVDGSHESDDTLLDAELAWRLARNGALFILDDYCWETEPVESIHHPKRGIDAFMAVHAGQYDVVHRGYQIILRKTVPQRIGFLTKEFAEDGVMTSADLDYGINLALCIDEAYAMAAAVTIRSAVVATPNTRISVYIVECGVTEDTRRKVESSMPPDGRQLVTLIWLPLSLDSRGATDPTWAKVDLVDILPVERVLYLDADVLVRRSLRDLWDTDLKGNAVAAVRDIGHPFGHEGTARTPYFNAGVMVLDLASIRLCGDVFRAAMAKHPETTYKDQDALNIYFTANWLDLDPTWNATGLGTYARWPTTERDAAWPNGELARLHEDPHIVHFTGPVHPKMESVVNEFVQPCISKPWGYAGAQGHPFTEEWWSVCAQTAWSEYRKSSQYAEECSTARKVAVERGIATFNANLGIGVSSPGS